MSRIALEVRNLSKTFPGQKALDDVNIVFTAGKIHGLVGHNGSGKSTLVKVLAGYHSPDPGSRAICGDGSELVLGSAESALAAGIRFVHQDLALIPALSVADNVHLTGEHRSRFRRIRRRSEEQSTQELMTGMGYDIEASARVQQLKQAERAAVALGRALRSEPGDVKPSVLVLDEVSACLPGPEVELLAKGLRRLADDGIAIVYIAHDLQEVLSIADTVSALRNGKIIGTVDADGTTVDGLVEMVLGRELAVRQSANGAAGQGSVVTAGRTERPIVELCQVEVGTLRSIDLKIWSGEIVGVGGLTGSGREELADAVAGAVPRGGQVLVNGVEVPGADPRAGAKQGVGYVPAKRMERALLPSGTVRENMTVNDVGAFWRRWRLNRTAEREEVRRWVDRLAIRSGLPEQPIGGLSGGNQQKVVLARALRVEPVVLVLDEPTQGVDVGSREGIHQLVEDASGRGIAVLLCSSDAEELVRVATRVVILQQGRVVGELVGDEIALDRIEELQLAASI